MPLQTHSPKDSAFVLYARCKERDVRRACSPVSSVLHQRRTLTAYVRGAGHEAAHLRGGSLERIHARGVRLARHRRRRRRHLHRQRPRRLRRQLRRLNAERARRNARQAAPQRADLCRRRRLVLGGAPGQVVQPHVRRLQPRIEAVQRRHVFRVARGVLLEALQHLRVRCARRAARRRELGVQGLCQRRRGVVCGVEARRKVGDTLGVCPQRRHLRKQPDMLNASVPL